MRSSCAGWRPTRWSRASSCLTTNGRRPTRRNEVDEAKWPDLPGFIGREHEAGRKVLLWLKMWDPEGVPPEECVRNAAGTSIAVDPGNPAYEARLRASVRRMLGHDGYGADGFKIDFSARIPSGPGLQHHGQLWGLELMRRYLEIIYDEAKRVKPDALDHGAHAAPLSGGRGGHDPA
jgi:hypothetical protein